jgi:hypothetical protein
MYDSFKKLTINLSKYLYNESYCDCIDPHYSIPILDHNELYSLSDFFPIEFKDQNLSSDEGLYNIIIHLIEIKIPNKYQIILVDVGIFWRYYKWLYNPSIRIPSSLSTSYILGFWHTYKELCQLIYQKSIRYFFGPIIGLLYKNSSLLFKPKLGILEYYFNLLMICYPLVKDKLYYLIANSTNKIKIVLKNIRFLFESAIPFVCILYFIFNFENFQN